jgi:POT family proton-dependent oligopeptide transporter
MKSFVQSLYLFTNALGSALNEAFVPATGDPDIMWMYTGIGVAAVATGGIFWTLFHHYDQQEEEMNKLDAYDSFAGKPGEESDGETTASARHAPQQFPEEKV